MSIDPDGARLRDRLATFAVLGAWFAALCRGMPLELLGNDVVERACAAAALVAALRAAWLGGLFHGRGDAPPVAGQAGALCGPSVLDWACVALGTAAALRAMLLCIAVVDPARGWSGPVWFVVLACAGWAVAGLAHGSTQALRRRAGLPSALPGMSEVERGGRLDTAARD